MEKTTFDENFLDLIKKNNDIIEIASEYFKLKKFGDIYKTNCIHDGGDKTPSLTFWPKTQSFYCFSCHAGDKNSDTGGSDIISFIQWIENVSWQEAVIMLAEKANISIPKAKLTAEEKKRKTQYDKALQKNREYWANLYKPNAKHIKEWFNNRHITDEMIAKWRLGAYLVSDKDTEGCPVYAILDEQGRTVAFSRRVDTPDNKYVNDRTNDIFKKGNILYGLNFIKKEIRKADYMVIVEGYNDAITLQHYDVPAVAIMSTTITDEQIKLIKKYTKNVILFLDGDQPGIDHTISNIKELKKEGLEVEAINILGFDPDEVALKYKDKTLDFILKNKKLAFQFLINNVLDKYFNNIMKLKKETLSELKEILNYIDNETERTMYEKQLVKILSMENKE